MSALTELLDQLIALDAQAKAANDLAKPVRAKAQQLVLERWQDEGADRFVRPGGAVTLVKPNPHVDVTQPETLAAWLEDNGRDELVTRTVVVLDAQAAVHLLQLVADKSGNRLDLATAAESAFDVRKQPVADWSDHVQWEATDDGDLVTPDGELIPGCKYVAPEPQSIRVVLDKSTRDAAALVLAGEHGLDAA